MIKTRVNEVGNRYGRLVVLYQVEDKVSPSGNRLAMWHCKCDCGNECDVIGAMLRNKNTSSCGCFRKSPESKNTKKYNRYEQDGNTGIGYDYKNRKFYFDWEDYDLIKDYSWSVNAQGYVRTQHYSTLTDILMHRLIVGCPKEFVCDHINHNRADNRKSNLRICRQSDNCKNQILRCDNTSGCTGVRYLNDCHKWEARLVSDGEFKLLKKFATYDEAVAARKECEIKYFKEFRNGCDNDE